MEPKIPVTAGQATGIGVGAIIIWLIIYIFSAYCLARMAKKMGRPFGNSFIMALIPIANFVLLLQMAARPMWWIILILLVPIVNLVLMIIVWIDIIKKLGRPGWWVVLLFIPIVNIVIFLILAFEKIPEKPATI